MKDCMIALDAGGTYLKSCLLCGARAVDGTQDRQSADSDGTLYEVHEAYTRILTRMKAKAEASNLKVTRVGVDIPGPFDFAGGVSRMKHKYTAIYGVPLRPWFYEVLGDEVEVSFIHDSAAFIAGVQSGKYRNIAGAMIGTGLGFAMMKDKKVCLAEDGGPLVSIYNRPYRGGIAEDIVSARGIIARYNSQAPLPLYSAKDIGDLADAGDSLAMKVYVDTGAALAEILHDVLAANEIEALFLGGQISKSFNIFGDAIKKGLQSVPTLKLVTPVADIDNVHLHGIGAACFA